MTSDLDISEVTIVTFCTLTCERCKHLQYAYTNRAMLDYCCHMVRHISTKNSKSAKSASRYVILYNHITDI